MSRRFDLFIWFALQSAYLSCVLPEVESTPETSFVQSDSVGPAVGGGATGETVGARGVEASPASGEQASAQSDTVCLGLGCSPNALCVDRSGSKVCECRSGFAGDGKVCEALSSHDSDCTVSGCGSNAGCAVEATGPVCRCLPGFSGDADHCLDIDECAGSSSRCGRNAHCENMLGTFMCKCDNGWSGDGTTCVDVDECLMGSPCGTVATCKNAPGSFVCQCSPGFDKDGTACVAHNPCTPNPCGPGACKPMGTSFTCDCGQTDFTGTKCETRIDDCASNPCGMGGDCVDGDRSFTCNCKPGNSGMRCESNVCNGTFCGRKTCNRETGACMAVCFPNCAGLGEPCNDNGDCESVCCGIGRGDTYDNCLPEYSCPLL